MQYECPVYKTSKSMKNRSENSSLSSINGHWWMMGLWFRWFYLISPPNLDSEVWVTNASEKHTDEGSKQLGKTTEAHSEKEK